MCYAGVSLVGRRDLVVVQGRWFVLQTSNLKVPEPAPNEVGGEGGGGSVGGSTKQCVCSPTKHPGSFRCRHHHAEYVWPCRKTKNQSTQ